MALFSSLSAVALAAVLLDPVFVEENRAAAIVREIAINNSVTPTARLELAAVDFCYRGTIADTETGEVIELYALCSEDAIEGNLDLG
jgi:hypothetical protein